MELQNLDINRFIRWYRNRSIEIFCLSLTKDRCKRLFAAVSYITFIREIGNSQTGLSKTLANVFLEQAKEKETQIRDIESDIKHGGYYFLSLDDWQMFDFMRNNALEVMTEGINEQIERSALPEIEIYQNELHRKNKEYKPMFAYAYETGTPFIKGTLGENFLFDFTNEVSDIDYCKWLYARINELTTPADTSRQLPPLEWQADQKDFTELIKALSLTAFAGIPETEIIRYFAPLIKIEGKSYNATNHSHTVSVLETSYNFMDKLSKEIKTYYDYKATSRRKRNNK